MSIFRAPLIAALTMISWAAFAQQGTVRVITGDTEHIYGYGGQVLDDDGSKRETSTPSECGRSNEIAETP
jgi:hypothetical protein